MDKPKVNHDGVPVFELLEPRLLLNGSVVVSEFMASNNTTILDGDGESSDWIELYNPTDSPVNLDGWFLSDKTGNPDKWRIPNVTLAAAGDPGWDDYLLIFASGRDDSDYPYWDGQYYHTNFELSKEGENVLLVRDDGSTIEHGYEDYPEQFTDISYGIYLGGALWETLVGDGAELAYHVPTAGDAGDVPEPGVSEGWTAIDFDDSAWTDSMVFGAAGIVISEINTGVPNFVEIQNVSDAGIDTTGWSVLVNDASGTIGSVNTLQWDLGGEVAAGEILYRSDDPGDPAHYWGGNIDWAIEGDGWAMIVDDTGDVVDFVAWGYLAEEITDPLNFSFSYEVSPGVFVDIDARGQWSGDGADLTGGGEPGPEENAIPFNSVWDYMHPLDSVDPAGSDGDFNSTWMLPDGSGYDGPAFDHSGEAVLGYGQINLSPIVTNIGVPSGSRYSGYFRSEFVLDEPMIETGIEILNDDGAFVYIDGVEVFRNNISPTADDTYTTFALNHTYPDGVNVENVTKTFSIADLDEGTHTIAVSVHQANTGSSDLGLDLRLFGRPVVGGELLQRTGQSDSDTASDFDPNNDPTRGAQNPDMTVPFGVVLDTTTGIGFSDDQLAFEDIIETDAGADMEGVNASLWTRIEFVASEELTAMGTLTLSMMYDDGFVAYINGVQVAQRNAPPAMAWDSSATAAHSDMLAVVYEEIDISTHMGLLLEGANVLAIHGLNYDASDADLLIKPKLVGTGDVSMPRHFAEATPGRANNEEWWHYVEDTTFSHDRGFYTAPFDLAISTDTVDAQIYYTTNGTSPLMDNGSIHADATEYTAPITIGTTTVVRAVAVKATWAPTNVDTQTYLFLNDVINQPANPTGFPSAWGGTTADYQMDPDVVYSPTYQTQMIDALQSIPTMSIVMDVEDMFGSSGIYTNSGGQGLGWERETSLEYFDPNSTDEFQVDAGLRIYGGAFRGMGLTRKKSFRVLFKGDYGPTKLDFPLFDAEGAATSFDNLVLRAGANDGWNNWGKANTQYIIDEYMRQLQLALEQPSGHGTFVHLYINGLYWGLYNPIERPEASFCATYFGGDKEDWDALNSGSPTGESNTATWSAMLSQVRAGACTDEAYQKIQGNNPDGTNNPAYNDMLDVDNLIAYMFSNIWGGTGDWPGHNWYAAAQRPPEGTGWKFFNWDAEGAIVVWSNVGANVTGVSNSAAEPYAWLRGNAEFNLLFGDYAHQWLFNDGPASYSASFDRYQELASEIELAVIGESARWGDQGSSTPYTQAHWASTRDGVLGSYMPARPTNVLNQLKGAGLYPNTVAPVFRIAGSYQHGGKVSLGAQFSMAGGDGTIYYTTDGTDPRQVGGAAIGTEYLPGQTIMLIEPTRFRARRLVGGQWSALNDATYYINPPAAGGLTVTEVNYNPYGPTNAELLTQPPAEPDFTPSDFEFIELYNKTGHSIDLFDVEFRKGVELTIPPGPQTTLGSGQYAVIVANASAFEARYGSGINVVGVFDGSLDNGGEDIIFGHPVTPTLEAFEYNDAGSWPNRADGGGSSLELIDLDGDLGMGSNWRSSSEYGGSPGLIGAGPRSDVVVNEVLTHSDDPLTDFIELYNTTDAPIDISGWFLSDGGADYAKFEIPAGTEIPVGGHVVFYEGHYVAGALQVDYPTEFGGTGEKDFALSGSHGDDVWLMEADASGKLLSFVDHVDFGGAINGESFGRWPDGTGDLCPMTSVTLENANSPPRVGPVIISEVMYHAPGPGGAEADDLEFIELYNPTPEAIDLAVWKDNPHGGAQYFADWRLRGGVDMEFDAGTTIASGGMLVVLSFDPNKPENATRVAAFKDYYGIADADPAVLLTGGYSGKLDNGGDRITLQRPDSPPVDEPGFVPHVIEDEVNYDDVAPWVTPPDGLGDSLQRTPITGWGDDPVSWIAAAPDPGAYAAINNAPIVVNPIGDVNVDEDSGDDVLNLLTTFDDPDIPLDTLTLSVTGNTNVGLVTANMIGTDLTLSYIPDRNGAADITVRATDSHGAWVEETFTVTVDPVEDAPIVANPIGVVADDEDASDRVIDLTNVFGDPDLPDDTLVFSVTINTNTDLVTPNIADGELTLSYVANQHGAADITVRATDQGGAGTWVDDTFTVTVDPINDAPTVVSQIGDVADDEDASDRVIDLSGVFDDVDLPDDTLTLSVTINTNTDLVTPNIADGELTLSYAADQHGTADITVRATDSGMPVLFIEDTFTVTVDSVNDDPTVAGPIDDVVVTENAPDSVLDLSATFYDPDVPPDTLTLSVTGNSNSPLVTPSLAGTELRLSYAEDQSGTADITIRATDLSDAWIEDVFTVTVNHLVGYLEARIDLGTGAVVLANIDPPGGQPVNYNGLEIRSTPGLPTDPGILNIAGWWPILRWMNGTPEQEQLIRDELGDPLFVGGWGIPDPGGNLSSFGVLSPTPTNPSTRFFTEASAGDFAILRPDSSWSLGNPIIPGSTLTPILEAGGVGDFEIVYSIKEDARMYRVSNYVFFINNPPAVANPIADVDVSEDADDTLVNLANVFEDADPDDVLTLSVEDNTNLSLVTTDLVGDQLTLSYAADQNGSAVITVRATDSEGDWVEDDFTVTVDPVADIVGRHVFYNNSAWDAGGDDGAAIAPDKEPLLPGPEGVASFANYTSYWRGINGIMVDIEDPPETLTAEDFAFRVNQAAAPDTWSEAPSPESVTVQAGGVGEPDRVTIVWADGAIVNKWVEVKVLATANTGLDADDVFYYGNVVGETDEDGVVDGGDYVALVAEFGLRGGIGAHIADFNADGRVDLVDFAIARGAYGNEVGMPLVPAAAPPAAAPLAAAAAPVVPNVNQTLDNGDAGDDSIAAAASAPPVDLLLESPPAVDYISGPPPISVGSPATAPYRAATVEYDLQPLGDDLPTGGEADLLVDILAESPLAVPL